MAVWSDIMWPIDINIGFMDPCVDLMAWTQVKQENKKLELGKSISQSKCFKTQKLDLAAFVSYKTQLDLAVFVSYAW